MTALFLAIAAPRVYAQIRIAVVDMQRAILETDEGRLAKTQLKGLFQKRQEEIDHRQRALKQLRDQLERDRPTLDDAAYQQRAEHYQKQFVDLQENFLQYQRELAQREAELTKQIYVNLQSVVRQLSQREGYTAVFEQGGVVFAQDGLEITDRVVQAYNTQFPPGHSSSSSSPPPGGSSGAPARPRTPPATQRPAASH